MRCLWLLAVVAGCGSSNSGTTALYQMTGSDFYALPFPNDLHRHDDGSLDMSAFPTNSLLASQYRDVSESLDGFALSGQMSSRFSGPVDATSVPKDDGEVSMTPDAPVYLIRLTDGARTPVIASYRDDGTNTIGGNRLVVRPTPGFPLDEQTQYGLVITNRIMDVNGKPVERSSTFAAIMGGGGDVRARNSIAPLLALLDPAEKERVVSAAVFTTESATFAGPALRMGVFGTATPTASNVMLMTTQPNYTLWTGTYVAPNFQTGDPPYLSSGGEIQYDATGAAIVQRMENMRFALTLPTTMMPTTGWPLCIYQHGTGGDWMSFVDDKTADALAAQGIAVISTDQVLHGPRNPGGDPAVSFFNFGNPYAGRDNPLQGAADAWSQMRLGLNLQINTGSGTATFDPAHLLFFGHSQGGLTGPAFIANESGLEGAVLSGTGGVGYLGLLYKLAPVDFPMLVETLTRDTPMDEDNPTLALAQMWIERSDTVNYAKYFVREPIYAPKNIFQTEGFTDTYAPNPSIEAFATSVGGDIVKTGVEKDVPGLTALRGRHIIAPPMSDNYGRATAVLAQYNQAAGSDGHFVVFDITAARVQSSNFLGTLARTGTATVTSP
jgi:hypothetical protein